MKNKPKWVVYDVGGVLLDWRGGLHTAGELLKVADKEILEFLQIYLKELELGTIPEEKFWELAAAHFKTDLSYFKIAQSWIDGQPTIPAGWETVRKLKNEYKLAICTNNWLSVMENQIKRINGFKDFEIIIDSSQEKVRKPDAKMYQLVENKLGAKGNEIFFIDDSSENIEKAAEFGWQTFLFDATENEGLTSAAKLEAILLTKG